MSVVGCPGSGKSTLARSVASRLGVPCFELDAFHHLPGWKQRSNDEMIQVVEAALAPIDGWVVDGNYNGSVGRAVRAEADLIVFLDLPRSLVMRRIVARTLRRAVTREVLWNGNREPWSNLVSLDPAKNIIRYAWDNHPRYHREYHERMADGQWDHAEVVTLRSASEVDRWLDDVDRRTNPPSEPGG